MLTDKNLKKWLRNTATFLAPALLVFLTALQSGMPVKEALVALYTWALSTAIDFLKKYINSQKEFEQEIFGLRKVVKKREK